MGCFASVLSRALDIANRYRQDQISHVYTKGFTVYRGLSLFGKDLSVYKVASLSYKLNLGIRDQEKKEMDETINMAGYNSTSQDRDVAIGFALKNRDPNRHSVLMEIDLKEGTTSGFCFVMN